MKRRIAIVAAALVLSACASAPPVQRDTPFWSGRLGLQVLTDPPQSYQAGFELQGSARSGELTLLSPIGSVVARVQWDERQAVLERGSERWQHASVDQLIGQLIPAAVPMADLFEWLHGRAAGGGNWQADLSEFSQGRIQAQRVQPLPRAQLRLALDL